MQYLALENHGQGDGYSQYLWPHLTSWNRSIYFIYNSSISNHFPQGYTKLNLCPWKCNVNVMAIVKIDGQIWCIAFLQLCGNQSISSWDIANSITDLDISYKGHGKNKPKSNEAAAGKELVRKHRWTLVTRVKSHERYPSWLENHILWFSNRPFAW